MIGLPTITTSRTSAGGTAGGADQSSSASSAERAADRAGERRVATRVHHHVRHPAHQVLAEPDLRVHASARREHLTGREVAQVAGDGGGPDVDRDAARRGR